MKHLEKSYQERFEDLLRSNKERKLKLANEAGFSTVEGYKNFLVSSIQGAEVITPIEESKPKIHNVYILDVSGSMAGEKLNNAIEGINSEIGVLKTLDIAEYTQTIVTFSFSGQKKYVTNNLPIKDVTRFTCHAGGYTALNETIGKVLSTLLKNKGSEKVLVKIFTDGEENDSRGHYANSETVALLIKECEDKGFTITFVGTKKDTDNVIKTLKIDYSNTLVHDNTGRGVEMAFMASTEATVNYSKAVVRGEDVLTGFYKKEGKL